jgi:hypothetical protein
VTQVAMKLDEATTMGYLLEEKYVDKDFVERL